MAATKSAAAVEGRLYRLVQTRSHAGSVDETFRRIDRGDFHLGVANRLEDVALRRFPPDLRPGSIFSYALEHWPVTLDWDAVVSEYQPPNQIRWVQSRGYFPKWDLSLELRDEGPSVESTVTLVYEMPTGVVASMKNRYVVRQVMQRLIDSQLESIASTP